MPLKLLWQLSVRNLLRHRRRTVMLIAAITVAVAGVAVLNSLIRGFQYDLAESAVANLTGHVKVLAPGYRDDPSIEKSFKLAADWRPDVDAALVDGWAPRVRVPAVIMSERETRGVQLVGVDPARERISFLSTARYEGEPLSGPDDRRIVIGVTLAEQLESGLGRRLVIITQGADGLNREAGFRVAGLFDAEGTSLEKAYVFTGLERLQGLLDADVVTEISVRLHEDDALAGIKRELFTFFVGLDVVDWRELEPQAATMFALVDTVIYIWFLIMMGALAFGLVNTLITSVMERVKEFGLLRAVGMRASSVVVQVVIESSVVMAVGVVIGLCIGALLGLWLADGIDLSRWAEGMELAGMRSVLVPRTRVADFVVLAAMSMALGLFASLYPAWRATKIKPLEAMRR